MKAMILAAGKGTRVRPLTYVVPKPMIPLLGRPVMEFLVDHLRAHGFNQIVVNTSYLSRQIENYFRDGHRFGVDMAYSFEGSLDGNGVLVDAPLGSAGALRRIQDFSRFFDHTFVVLCGDAIIDLDLTMALAAHRANGAIATLVAKRVEKRDVSNHGIVVTGAGGRIRSFQDKPIPSEALSALANTGIYIFEPAIFNFIPPDRVFDIVSELFPALLAAGAPFYAAELPFEWVDIGTTQDFWSATMKLLLGQIDGARIPGTEVLPGVFAGLNVSLPRDCSGLRGPIWIGGSTSIGEGARVIGPTAIGSGSVVEPGAIINRSIILDYTRVSSRTTLQEQIVCGSYCVSSNGATVSLADAGLLWAIDDARRTSQAADEPYAAEGVLSRKRSDRDGHDPDR